MANLSDHISDEQRAALQKAVDEQHQRQEAEAKKDRGAMLKDILKRRKRAGYVSDDGWLRWTCRDADVLMMHGLAARLGDRAQWLDEYEGVADWLSDNHGKGLMCIGDCGRGKSLLTCDIIPRIFEDGYVRDSDGCRLAAPFVTTAKQLRQTFKEALRSRIIVIDEVGQEGVVNEFGEHHDYFADMVLEAERLRKTIILSTNLNYEQLFGGDVMMTDGSVRHYEGRYNDARIIDRLTANTVRVFFEGESLRG